MPTKATSRQELLESYAFPVEPAHDFERSGIPAQFASGHPKHWDQDIETIDFSVHDKGGDQLTYSSYHTALSTDQRLLAISTRAEHILIYDVASKELRQVLQGAGSLAFRPSIDTEERTEGNGEIADREGYTLVSSISDSASRGGPKKNRLVFWDLDQHGRIVDEEEAIDPAIFAAKAVAAIASELSAGYEWTKEFISASTLQADFEKALAQAAADHSRRHNTILDDAHLANFGSVPFSSDGRLFLYHTQNGSTQQGTREPDALPMVVLYDVDTSKELFRFSGHTDAIMWSAISPDSEYVASVSWDGTLRMYTVSSGELLWASENSGGQSWAGAFSADSEHIVWSSKNGHTIQVHNVANGNLLSTFQEKFTDWCRCLVWHPTRKEIALCVDQHAYVWDVFNKSNDSVLQHFQLDGDGGRWRHIASIERVAWMDNGQLLSLECSEGTKLVYDTASNAKELFMRSTGAHAAWVDRGFYGLFRTSDDEDFYLSIDGDGKIRHWRSSVAAYPSWWEKEIAIMAPEKKPFPETGKYVKITKKSDKPPPQEEEASRDTWAGKGAELWTAE